MNKTIQAKQLLRGGVFAGLVFYGVAFVEMLFRPGFNLARHPVSMLSLGEAGWIQILNFLISGSLVVLCALGMRKLLKGGKAGTWGPILIGLNGIGFILAGIFTADPANGFPAGAPEGLPEQISAHASLHFAAFSLAFLALTVACFVFARRFLSDKQTKGLGVYSLLTGIIAPVVIGISASVPNIDGILAAAGGIISFTWLAVVAGQLIKK